MSAQFPAQAKRVATVELLTSLVAQRDMISAVFTFSYHHPPLLQGRVDDLSKDEKAIIEKALSLRSSSSLPFWEALMLSCFGEHGDCARFLREATFHQSHRESLQRVSREEVLAGRLIQLAESQPASTYLSFSSLVEVDKSDYKHLPLLDFHCPESDENDRLVAEACKLLFRSSVFVLSSGESYHAVGSNIVDEAEFRMFLGRALLLAPIVDARYVAHQLMEGACALRLSCSAEKPKKPNLKFQVP